jgi:methylmalonyl-CoA/ethylmalonyl-CoA epimerase
MVPENATMSAAPCRCTGINQIGIVVSDVEEVARNYWEILGIGPWTVFDWESPLVYDRTYKGEKVSTRERIATAQVGNLQLELLQPVEGPSIYRDWILEHGEGLHHMNFSVDDMEATGVALAGQGFPCMASGKFRATRGGESSFAYFATEPLRAIAEPVHLEGPPEAPGRLVH